MLKLFPFLRRPRDLPFTVPADAEAPWQSEQLGELSPLSRALLVMRPRQPYAAWVAATQDQPEYTVATAREHDSVAFLIPTEFFDGEEAMQFVADYWPQFFAQGLSIWEADSDRWPRGRTQAMFEQWFELAFCEQVLDLGGYPTS